MHDFSSKCTITRWEAHTAHRSPDHVAGYRGREVGYMKGWEVRNEKGHPIFPNRSAPLICIVRLYVIIVTASRNVSAAVNSSIEFRCSKECTSNVTWSYLPPASSTLQLNNFSLLTPPCLKVLRCQIEANAEMVRNLLNVDQVQFNDAGTYLCTAVATNQLEHCEMSYQLMVSGMVLYSVQFFCSR